MPSPPNLPFHAWAERPPLGWNSWDCFATTVTEAQVRAQAEVMARQLHAYGWEYIVVDIQWYEPGSEGYAYREGAEVALDAWGRLLPAVNRFPSASDGAGFTKLAADVHALGLQFGVHLMRGIPRRAVEKNTPILGTAWHARDVANLEDRCPWNPDMFGVDMSRPGAQAYYDSVFALFASWGVDYVKLDDMSRPYHDHEPEIEAVRRAVDKTGRPMVLSFSPGETALTAAEHVKLHANLWRISDDFWDNWHCLYEQFARAKAWNRHRGRGHWPDLDMLPLGMLRKGQCASRLSQDEQLTLMTLWCVARSPLMFGGDLTKLDAFTRSLLTNPEVLRVNQASERNQVLFERDGLIAWTARPEAMAESSEAASARSDATPDSGDEAPRALYLALFNTKDQFPLVPERAAACVRVPGGSTESHRLEAPLHGARTLVLQADDGVDNAEHPVALWAEPLVHFADGSVLSLQEHAPRAANAWWGDTPRLHKVADDALELGSERFAGGYTAPTRAELHWDLPAGAVRFEARVGFAPRSAPKDSGRGLRFLVFAPAPEAASRQAGVEIIVTAAELGVTGPFEVRDLWQQCELGTFSESFAPNIPWHGARLYLIR